MNKKNEKIDYTFKMLETIDSKNTLEYIFKQTIPFSNKEKQKIINFTLNHMKLFKKKNHEKNENFLLTSNATITLKNVISK